MSLVHRQSQIIMNEHLKTQNQGAKCSGNVKGGEDDAGVCGVCVGWRWRIEINIGSPWPENPGHPFPQGRHSPRKLEDSVKGEEIWSLEPGPWGFLGKRPGVFARCSH